MSTIKPFEIIMRPYLWDLSDLSRPPKCPFCLGEVIIPETRRYCTVVFVACRQCGLEGPEVEDPSKPAQFRSSKEAKHAAAKRWNQFIERIYHLAHGVIPAPSKKED